MMLRTICCTLIALFLFGDLAHGQTRDQKVRNDRQKVEAEGFWIYNDLPKAYAQARETGKPILVVLRCIPCEECVKLDDDLVDRDPRVRPLLQQFVCARVISTNGLDLGLFQFDTDQSFAVFMLNADGTIYGRYGTRSHRTSWADDVSIEGLARALEGALELHGKYPTVRASLAGKRGPRPEFATPEQYPQHKDRYGPMLNYEKNVAQSCIHCHQIGDAQRQLYRDKRQPIPDQLLFSYPHPKGLGLILDPKERATVARVDAESPAEQAGLRAGDRLLSLQGQPLLSIADVQWVLHQTPPSGATLKAVVRRGESTKEIVLTLPAGWRERDDLSWRASTWGLRRMALGGLLLEALPEDQQPTSVEKGQMALRVKHVGQYGPHAAAKQAGFKQGDIIVAFDGRQDLLRETDCIAHALRQHQPGATVKVTVLREGKKHELKLPMQN